MPTLILTPRFTEDAQALWRAAGQLGWSVERLVSWSVSEEVQKVPDPVLYLEALFGPTIAEQFGLRLLEPPEDWVPRLPLEYRRRQVELMSLHEARKLSYRAFIKPPNDKSFPAKVYSGHELPEEYDGSSSVLVSEIVSWEVEFRCFILDRQPQTISVYLRNGELQKDQGFLASEEELAQAEKFVRTVTEDKRVDLPRASVLDVGVISDRGWAVVEQNAAWGSGIYGCDPKRVLEVLRHAAVPI